jgi:hypothetical protein
MDLEPVTKIFMLYPISFCFEKYIKSRVGSIFLWKIYVSSGDYYYSLD